jgi:Fur family ferric uptake transcriptional regulator
VATDAVKATIDEGIDAIRSGGGRVTPAKRLLLELFAQNPGHLTVEELTEWVQTTNPEIASSTVYRIVEELERIGIVEHSHAGKGPATYHFRHAAHGHLVCHECGEMIEADPDLFVELVAEANKCYGFVVDPHHFAVLGSCRGCLAAQRS